VVGNVAGRVFTLRLSRGWATPEEFDDRLDEGNPAVARAVERREVTVVKDASGVSAGDILACAPLVDASRDEVLGLIVIERIPFVRLTAMTVSHLFTIAGWVGKTLADARRFDTAMDARVDDEATGTYNHRFLTQRLAEEAQRVRRYGGSCTYLLVKLLDHETLGPDERRLMLSEMGVLLRRLLRTVDVVGVHREIGSFGIILPSTTVNQAAIVTARVNESFRKTFGGYGSRFAHLRLKMGISSTTGAEPLSEARLMEEAERMDLRQGR
jgi:diguanylate cyclase (GGDEF)-like protein